jgi:hypothetical protein
VDTARRFAAGDHSARPDDLGRAEFQELANALGRGGRRDERPEQARQHLTADIAHELRTPLTRSRPAPRSCVTPGSPADTLTLAAPHDQAGGLLPAAGCPLPYSASMPCDPPTRGQEGP